MFTGIASYEIFSRRLGCQKFTSSIPGCCEEEYAPLIICEQRPKLFISYYPERLPAICWADLPALSVA
jgi:hypothetical protein